MTIIDDIYFFQSEKEFLNWIKKNYKKETPLWLGFYKRAVDKKSFSIMQAAEIAMCYGWTSNVLSAIDYLTFKAKFAPRNPKSVWSSINVKKFLELRKKGLVHASGEKAFQMRDQKKSKQNEQSFSTTQLKKFKSNAKAWAFFNTQTPSYRKYMQSWVVSAKKTETQDRRLEELIQDSASGTKLKRILAANEKIKKRFEPGKTPIEEGKNLGPLTGIELRSIGIETIEQLKRQGWEQVFQKLVSLYPHRFNMNMIYSLAGAAHDQNRRQLDPDIKLECKNLFSEMQRHSNY